MYSKVWCCYSCHLWRHTHQSLCDGGCTWKGELHQASGTEGTQLHLLAWKRFACSWPLFWSPSWLYIYKDALLAGYGLLVTNYDSWAWSTLKKKMVFSHTHILLDLDNKMNGSLYITVLWRNGQKSTVPLVSLVNYLCTFSSLGLDLIYLISWPYTSIVPHIGDLKWGKKMNCQF